MKTQKKEDKDEGEKVGKKFHCVWASPSLGDTIRNVTL
jgi:hypothetical protein